GYDASEVYAEGGPVGREDAVGFEQDNEAALDECFGLSVEYELRCDFDLWLCSMRDALRTPLWYLLGAETLRRRWASDRFNRFTTLDRENLQALTAQYEARYEQSLKTACRSIRLPDDPCFCFDPPVQYRYL
ncbi:MAG: hypothetical protein NZ534_08565, partial [Bacteroidia bacterium]|nr:hypothetical protein [Bacteroidia bacterium]